MGATTNFQLPYPELTDPADVPADVKELADRLEVVLGQVGILVGSPLPWLTSTIPSGFIEFAGQAIPVQYTKLRAIFGTNMPDLRNRFLFGVGGGYADGAVGGAALHTLTGAEMPSHAHTALTANIQVVSGPQANAAKFGPDVAAQGDLVGYEGGGQAHNNMPPYRTVRWVTLAA